MRNKFINFKSLIFIIPLFLVYIWFNDGLMMATAESGFPFYNLQYMQEISSHSWTSTNLGNAMGIRVASYPTYSMLAFFERIGVPNFMIQAGFFYFILVTAGFGIFYLSKSLFPQIKDKYLIIATLFYWFNPISIVSVWNRFLNNYMVFWALLPVASYFFYTGIKQKKYKYALLTSLSTIVFSYALTSPVFSILLWGLFSYTTIFFILTKRELKFYLYYFLLCLLTFILVNLWWLSSFFIFMFSADFAIAVNEFLPTKGNILTLQLLSSTSGSLVYTTRLLEKVFFTEGNPPWGLYFINPFLAIVQFGFFLMILLRAFLSRRNHSVLFSSTLFLVALFLVKGNSPPLGEIIESLFSKSLVFQGFRNPFEKFGFLLPLAFAPMVTFAIYKAKTSKKILILFLAILLLSYSYPFVSIKVFSYYKKNKQEIYDYKVEAPEEYKVVNKWLNENINEGERFLSLPIANEGITYNWNNKYSGVELSNTLYEVPNISYNTTIPFYSDIVKEMSSVQMTPELFNFLPKLNIKYIVLRKDIDYKDRRLPSTESIELMIQEYENNGLITKKLDQGKLSIYEVNLENTNEKIFVENELTYTNKIDNRPFGYKDGKSAVVQSNEKVKPDTYFIYPSDIFTSQFNKLESLSIDEIIARLTYVKYLPTAKEYKFIRLKEELLRPSSADFQSVVTYSVDILAKRAVEIYRLKEISESESQINSAQDRYINELSSFAPILAEVAGSQLGIKKYVFDSILAQKALLEYMQEEQILKILNELLNHINLQPKYNIEVNDNELLLVYEFSLPESGIYKINNFDRNASLYLNGIPVVSQTVTLEKGDYELSLIVSEDQRLKEIISLDDFVIESNSTPTIEIELPDNSSDHQISFDFIYEYGNESYISLTQDIDANSKPIFSSMIQKNPRYHLEQNWVKQFTNSVGSKKAHVTFSPVISEHCLELFYFKYRCVKADQDYKLLINNFRIDEIVTPDIFLTSQNEQVEKINNENSKVTWKKVDKTKYILSIEKQSNLTEYLIFSELYDSGWIAEDYNNKVIGKHFLANGYANAWTIDNPGEYQIVINYFPEKYLNLFKNLSLFFVFVITIITLRKFKKL